MINRNTCKKFYSPNFTNFVALLYVFYCLCHLSFCNCLGTRSASVCLKLLSRNILRAVFILTLIIRAYFRPPDTLVEMDVGLESYSLPMYPSCVVNDVLS
ncbi:hypothetical protein K449DRAFT_265708 [Hypoxylon sp. EC38]|nr:hypothetical protein K449DRAFT_265708 [Hypoxylon sp. EC38]